MGAALAVAVVALSGCASSSGEEATTAQTPDAPVNPWDLPLEERPDLFDPCAEIPIEAIEEGVGSPVQPVEQYSNNLPGDLISCGWKNDEVHVSVLSTWKSRQQFLTDSNVSALEPHSTVTGRASIRLRDSFDSTERGCSHLFFTGKGAFLFGVDQISGVRSFKGQQFVESCTVLDTAIGPTMRAIPEGDY